GGAGEERPWKVWDPTMAPVACDRFDCLDYFVSSQSQRDVMKWRHAEVVDVRHSERGTEILVHYMRWSSKWDRWVSLTLEAERFAPYQSRVPRPTEDSTRGGQLG
ncbi:unnamed protein product, partial [Laminaria digitata]